MNRTNESARRQPGADTSQHFTPKTTAPSGLTQQAKRWLPLTLWGLLPLCAVAWLTRPARQDNARTMRRHFSLIADSAFAADDAIVRNDRTALHLALASLNHNVDVVNSLAGRGSP